VPVAQILVEVVGRDHIGLVTQPSGTQRVAVPGIGGELGRRAEGQVVQRDPLRAEIRGHRGVLTGQQRSLHELDVLLLHQRAGVGQRDRRVAAGVIEVGDDAVSIDAVPELLEPEGSSPPAPAFRAAPRCR